MDKKQLKKLKNKLPTGAISEIAQRIGLSNATVSSVLSGKRNNEKVLELAIEIAELANRKRNEISERIESL